MPAKGDVYPWRIPDRQEVGRLRYQLRRFEKKLEQMMLANPGIAKEYREKMVDLLLFLDEMEGS